MNGRRMAFRGLPVLFAAAAFAADPAPLPMGVVIPKVQCLKSASHSYALYLPRAYRADRPWPVLFAFSPNARGEDPVRLFSKEADRLGFIVAGSNDSRNGAIATALKAQGALWEDVHARFNVDPKRSYATGFSGGSRMALRLALKHSKAFAGVISIGAFFAKEMGLLGSRHLDFVLLCGLEDFNHWELLEAQQELAGRGNAVWADRFPGPHDWPPEEICGQALAFMRIMADRRAGGIPDPASEAVFSSRLAASARAAEASGETLLALRRWREVVVHFPRSPEGAEASKAAARLEKDPGVIREMELESRYGRLREEITAMHGMPGYAAELVKLKNNERLAGPEGRFARQVLANETAMYWELGRQALDAGSWKRAAELFETLARLQDEEAAPCFFAACARAQLGEAGRAMDLLHLAAGRGLKNVKALKENPLLSPLRGNQDFLELIRQVESKAAER